MAGDQDSFSVRESLTAFLVSVIHTYLYQRGIYPRTVFTESVTLGVQVQVCKNPDVNDYIRDCISSLKPLLSDLCELRVVVNRPSRMDLCGKYLESLVLRFGHIGTEFSRRDVCSFALNEYFATVLLHLNLLECSRPPFTFETSWEICVRMNSSSVNLNEAGIICWDCFENQEHLQEDYSILPIKSFRNNNVQLQVFLEESLKKDENDDS
ncbi:unnamed protein product [Calicophoron daubneyi]|uniref:HORMA domain-containing protein n=1 Tax=Calicophoron daubneyi TaxID=300641 RepID=A0AAV2TBA2_CALDB